MEIHELHCAAVVTLMNTPVALTSADLAIYGFRVILQKINKKEPIPINSQTIQEMLYLS